MTVETLHRNIARHLDELKACFALPVRITIIIRHVHSDGPGIVLMDENEDPLRVVQSIETFIERKFDGQPSLTIEEATQLEVPGTVRPN